MPNIAKIVCGTRGSVGAFGAINPSIIFTLISGRPNTELTLTIDYYTPSMPPQDKKLIAPENDAALCNTLCAVSALEPDENESDAYYSEIMLDDGKSYRVRYSQLNVLISALWRSCSGCGFSSAPAPAQPAPQPPAGSWKCPACESQGQTGKYCTVCGTEKPQANSDG